MFIIRIVMAYFLDPLEMESGSEDEDGSDTLDISKALAKYLYDRAGECVKEDVGEISLMKYQHLLKDDVALIIEEVLMSNPLPYKLQEFQLLALHCIGSLKNVILISPTGRPLISNSKYKGKVLHQFHFVL